jgi:electron transport complex protein RnfB
MRWRGEYAMNMDVYQRLAHRLDATPTGLPATESGEELKILEKMFTLDEAALAAKMRLTPEPSAAIAARANVDPEIAHRTLAEMVQKGLVVAERIEDKFTFRLKLSLELLSGSLLYNPDKALAELLEDYTKVIGGITSESPHWYRVIPVEEAIPVGFDILPSERVSEIVKEAESIGVRKCYCRVQRHLIDEGCEHPVETCLILSPVKGGLEDSLIDRVITEGEALDILRKAKEAGLVHTTENYRDGHYNICACCPCSCAFLRTVVEFGYINGIARSDFRAIVESSLCDGCGNCIEPCYFEALSVSERLYVVDPIRCTGCGLCVPVCPVNALHLERLPESESPHLPADGEAWMVHLSEERGLSISDIL